MKNIFAIFALICVVLVFIFAPHWTSPIFFTGTVVLWLDLRGFSDQVKRWWKRNIEAAKKRKIDYNRYLELKSKGYDFDTME